MQTRIETLLTGKVDPDFAPGRDSSAIALFRTGPSRGCSSCSSAAAIAGRDSCARTPNASRP